MARSSFRCFLVKVSHRIVRSFLERSELEIGSLNSLAKRQCLKLWVWVKLTMEKMCDGKDNEAQDEVPESFKIKKWKKPGGKCTLSDLLDNVKSLKYSHRMFFIFNKRC